MSIYVPAESSARIQVAIAETVRRQVERKSLRAQMARARRVGLNHRHHSKLSREGTDMARLREKPIEIEAETEAAKSFRLADAGLNTAILHLRKLRTIPAARDALKLVRQAQNLVMDAEEDAE
jgi:histone acetyltransferase (RNA polymerase elongator complex component)